LNHENGKKCCRLTGVNPSLLLRYPCGDTVQPRRQGWLKHASSDRLARCRPSAPTLKHVFPDVAKPTGARYWNGVALTLAPEEAKK
jgi:hypothetical protein